MYTRPGMLAGAAMRARAALLPSGALAPAAGALGDFGRAVGSRVRASSGDASARRVNGSAPAGISLPTSDVWTLAEPGSEGWMSSNPALPIDGPLTAGDTAFKYVVNIINAKVYDVCKQTEMHHAPKLSELTGNRVLLKREDQQRIYSFKLRGAYNRVVHLTSEERSRGVCACSAGNHAQGVAYSTTALGLSAKIFMPKTTPAIKVDSVRRLVNDRSEVVLVGETYDEAHAATVACQVQEGRVLVHPFNDPLVITGQGTIAQEIVAQAQEPIDAVFCCVGGGGLLAGVGIYLRSVRPGIKIIGVEAADSAAMTESLRRGFVHELPRVGLFADGAAVKRVGEESFRLCQQVVDEMITVSTDEICSAIKASFLDTRVVMEPAGALAAAGLVKYAKQTGSRGRTYVAVSSGANMDFDRLRFVSERAAGEASPLIDLSVEAAGPVFPDAAGEEPASGKPWRRRKSISSCAAI